MVSPTVSADERRDGDITELLIARDERSVAEIDHRYGKLFRRIAFQILGNAEDAEECLNDAYLRLWETIPPQIPTDLRAYGCRIVRNLALNRYDYNTAQKRGGPCPLIEELDDSIPSDFSFGGTDEDLGAILDRFLRQQKKDVRVMFVLRYFEAVSLSDIAQRFGCSEQKVKSQLFRTRQKLKNALKKEGVRI